MKKIGEKEMTEFRKTERLENGKWVEYKFEDLSPGDLFRLFEPTGEIVKDKDNMEIFLATSDARACLPKGNFIIDSKPVSDIASV